MCLCIYYDVAYIYCTLYESTVNSYAVQDLNTIQQKLFTVYVIVYVYACMYLCVCVCVCK